MSLLRSEAPTLQFEPINIALLGVTTKYKAQSSKLLLHYERSTHQTTRLCISTACKSRLLAANTHQKFSRFNHSLTIVIDHRHLLGFDLERYRCLLAWLQGDPLNACK